MTVNAIRPELELEFNVLQNNVAISAFRNIANADKHVVLSCGSLVKDVKCSDHVAPGALNTAGSPEHRLWRLSVELRNGQHFYMEDLADETVTKWQVFFRQHDIGWSE